MINTAVANGGDIRDIPIFANTALPANPKAAHNANIIPIIKRYPLQ